MIERSEIMESTDADTNDRFSNPAMVATSEILNSLPKSEEEAKLFILKNGGDVRYLTWNEASESKRMSLKDWINTFFQSLSRPTLILTI